MVRVTDPCDACEQPVSDALARQVRLTVDRSQIDSQRLCPACFADWIERYRDEMIDEGTGAVEDDDGDIIVD